MQKLNPTKLQPGLGACYAIWPGKLSGLFYSSTYLSLLEVWSRLDVNFQLATAIHVTPDRQLTNYLQHINLLEFDADETPLMHLIKLSQYKDLCRLFDRLFSCKATSAPV